MPDAVFDLHTHAHMCTLIHTHMYRHMHKMSYMVFSQGKSKFPFAGFSVCFVFGRGPPGDPLGTDSAL